MSKCANCGTTLTCGCQKRTTADGKSACSNCVNKVIKPAKTTTTVEPTKKVWGPDRYKYLQKFTKK
jgi:recombinational DNA repair protein (RecF pathway)